VDSSKESSCESTSWRIEEAGLIVTMLAYLITNTEYFKEILHNLWGMTIFAFMISNKIKELKAITYGGVIHQLEVNGAITNIRDIGPMVAGLIGGPVMGVAVGLIGGVHRYFLGGFTALPCALATVLVGLFGGLIYRLRKGTFISVAGAVAFAALMEAFHMVLVLLLARPYSQAVLVVREVAMPMIVANALGIMIFAFMISNKIKELKAIEEREKSAQELYRYENL
jgi:sigma-B regulation protein RsbU (phosphoserine phosphatase)